MAGSFPDVPGSRFAYELDGTIVVSYRISGGEIYTVSNSNASVMNQNQAPQDPSSASVYTLNTRQLTGATSNFIVFLFPELRKITGYMISVRNGNPSGGKVIQTSADTINGMDGQWVTKSSSYTALSSDSSPLSPFYRNISNVNWSSVKALRVAIYDNISAVHIYGNLDDTANLDGLRVVDLTDNDISSQLDFGNILQRTSTTKQFKIKNNSISRTANNITTSLSATINSDSNPSIIGQYQISTDNISFANAVNIGDLPPGQSSQTLYLRMNASATAQLGPWVAQIIAHPASWS